MKTLAILLFFGFGMAAQQPKVQLPDEVAIAFEKDFPDAHRVTWSSDYRDNNELRYEATFYKNPANYMVSYSKTGEVKVLEKSLLPNQLLPQIATYLRTNYPSMKMNEASEVMTGQKVKTYEVGLAEEKKFVVAVFDDSGNFLFMRPVKN